MWFGSNENVLEDDDQIDSDTEQRLYAQLHHDLAPPNFVCDSYRFGASSFHGDPDSTSVRADGFSAPVAKSLTSVKSPQKFSNSKKIKINSNNMCKNRSEDNNLDYDSVDSKYHIELKSRSSVVSLPSGEPNCKQTVVSQSVSLKSNRVKKNKRTLSGINSTSSEIIIIDDVQNNYFDNDHAISKKKRKVNVSSDEEVICLDDLKTDVLINVSNVNVKSVPLRNDDVICLGNLKSDVLINTSNKSKHDKRDSNKEEFSVAKLQKSMTDFNWDIETNDRYRHVRSKVRYFKDRLKYTTCNKCKERGHLSKNCTNPRKVAVCYLCGEQGHFGFRCKNAICSNCLEVGHIAEKCFKDVFSKKKCSICTMLGHAAESCPDLWRRFHLTISAGDIVKAPMTWNSNVQCYNCCSKKHFGHQCKSGRMDFHNFSHYPGIISYDQPEKPPISSKQRNGLINWESFKQATTSSFKNKKKSMLNTVTQCFPNFPRNFNNHQQNAGPFGNESHVMGIRKQKKEQYRRRKERRKRNRSVVQNNCQ